MASLHITLLGSPSVTRADGSLAAFRLRKELALLAYLAVEGPNAQPREYLLGLLWPDVPEDAARNNLRVVLSNLRQKLGVAAPSADRQRIQLALEPDALDVAVFQRLLVTCRTHCRQPDAPCAACVERLEQALALYRGEFLAGFTLSDTAAFEEWVTVQREALHQEMLEALSLLADSYEQTGDYGALCRTARRQLELEPWHEPAQQQLMRGLALSGDREGALAQYERCREVLAEELGIEPDAATRALYDQIRTGHLMRVTRPATAPRHHLPAPLTPLVGREDALAALVALREQPLTRLLTLVGAGGMGKTRLAIEFGRVSLDVYADGVFFVALAPLAAAAELPISIAQTLNLTQQGSNPVARLLHFLRDKHMLLILDNFEHLRDGATLVAELLESAPRVQILVTSRERLNVRGEHLFVVEGLPYTAGTAATGEDLAAVRLFVQAARRAQPGFQLSAHNLPDVLRICQLVQGMPLGLELAAAWAEPLSVSEIAEEITRSIDFLAADWHDAPERQRSMRAVFAWSWGLLNPSEQQVFRRLSVFRGGFTREVAEAVVGASLGLLASLVHKSLLRRIDSGAARTRRYEVHELLRQFAEEQLATLRDERATVEERHSACYLTFVAERERRIFRDQLKPAVEELYDEIDNIRQAWRWASAQGQNAWLGRSAPSLILFCRMMGTGAEWEQLFVLAVEQLQARRSDAVDEVELSRDISTLIGLLGSTCMLQSKHKQAASWAKQAIACGAATGGTVGEVQGYLVMGQALRRQGQSEQARELLEQTVALAQRYQQDGVFAEQLLDAQVSAYNWLCSIALTSDDYMAATRYVEQGMQICRRLNKTLGTTILLTDMVDIAVARGDYVAARTRAEEALKLSHKLGYRNGQAGMLRVLSTLARQRGEYILAQELGTQALTSYRTMGNRVFEAIQCTDIAYICLLLGKYADAQTWLDRVFQVLHIADMPKHETQQYHLRLAQLAYATGDGARALAHATEAVQMAQQLDSTSIQLQALVMLGQIDAQAGQRTQAAEAYEQALARAERDDPNTIGLLHAGLAELALARGDIGVAQAHTEILVDMLDTQPSTSFDEPFRLFLVCYRVLAAIGDPRALPMAQAGQQLLYAYADHIPDDVMRRLFLENVVTHRALLAVAINSGTVTSSSSAEASF